MKKIVYILISIISISICLTPEYKYGFNEGVVVDTPAGHILGTGAGGNGRYVTTSVAFNPAFSWTPKVALALTSYHLERLNPNGFIISLDSVTT